MHSVELPADVENEKLAVLLGSCFERDLKREFLTEIANLIRVMCDQLRANIIYGAYVISEDNDADLSRTVVCESPKNALLRLRAVARKSNKNGDWREFVRAWASVSSAVHKMIWNASPARWNVLQQENPGNFVGFESSKVSFIAPRPEIAIRWIEEALLAVRTGRTGRQSRSDLDELMVFLVAVYRVVSGDNRSRTYSDENGASGGLHNFIATVSTGIDIGTDQRGRPRIFLGATDERRLRRISREVRVGGRLYEAFEKQHRIVRSKIT